MKRINLLFTAVVLFACISNVCAQDWPQYQGPNGNNTSPQKGILRTWPSGGPEVLWTVNVGPGYGGPVIKDGKVYLLDRDDKTGDIMRCFDFNTGKELWKFSYDAPGSVMFPGSRSVPAVDGNYVWSCGHNGDLYCINIKTQKPIWNKNIWTDFGGTKLPIWAITQCPLICGDLLIVSSQSPEAGVVAYNKLNGNIVWKTSNLGNESYASPSVVKIDGKDHIVMVISSTNPIGHRELPQTRGRIVGLEPRTGKLLWEYNDWECHISVPGALDAGNNKVLVTGGYEHGVVIEPSPSGFKPLATAEVLKTAGNSVNDQTSSSRMGGVAQNWAPLALAGGKLLIRDQSRLLCVRVAK